MRNLLIENVSAGMILADDVTDRQGRPLIKAGVEIRDKHIKIFKTWGIGQVNILGDDDTPAPQDFIDAHPQLDAEAQETMASIFQHVDRQHPVFELLIQQSREHFLRQKAAEL